MVYVFNQFFWETGYIPLTSTLRTKGDAITRFPGNCNLTIKKYQDSNFFMPDLLLHGKDDRLSHCVRETTAEVLSAVVI
jgi:hypothetical protein